MKLVKPESFNRCFANWAASMLPEDKEALTPSLDGNTIRSTGKMDSYENPLHIVSAQVAKLGITFAQQAVAGKSNEIPAVRELLKQLELGGCLVVADALNCQKETAHTILSGNGEYLIKRQKERTASKWAISKIMFDCLLDPSCICDISEN